MDSKQSYGHPDADNSIFFSLGQLRHMALDALAERQTKPRPPANIICAVPQVTAPEPPAALTAAAPMQTRSGAWRALAVVELVLLVGTASVLAHHAMRLYGKSSGPQTVSAQQAPALATNETGDSAVRGPEAPRALAVMPAVEHSVDQPRPKAAASATPATEHNLAVAPSSGRAAARKRPARPKATSHRSKARNARSSQRTLKQRSIAAPASSPAPARPAPRDSLDALIDAAIAGHK